MAILQVAVITVHVLLSIGLILLILLHSGRGGGLSDAFGGGMNTSMGGSLVAERNLSRLTVATVIGFTITTIALIWILA